MNKEEILGERFKEVWDREFFGDMTGHQTVWQFLQEQIQQAEKRGGLQELQRLSAHMDRQLDFFQSTVSIASLRNYIEEAMRHLETPTP